MGRALVIANIALSTRIYPVIQEYDLDSAVKLQNPNEFRSAVPAVADDSYPLLQCLNIPFNE